MVRTILHTILLGVVVVALFSCSGSKQSASMRQIEKHARKYPVDELGKPIPQGKAKKAMEQDKKKKAAAVKEAEKSHQDAITRHRANQTQEVRERMDRNLKESQRKYGNQKEFFIVRWFQPKDNVAKIEKQRDKEMQRRMAATRKKAEKTNKDIGITRTETDKKRKAKLPDPKDMPQGGGGVYKEGNAKTYVRPSNIQQGGGGSYTEGKSSSKVQPSDIQHGGGGTYKTEKPKKKSQSRK